jgi:hypothetical protein
MNIDDALTAYRGELIAAAIRWQAVRNRRRRNLVLATSALALAGVIVGAAVAATGWLVGAPAPRNVKSDFGSYAPQLGFNPEPGKAILVASDGDYKLYATPDKQGGYCTLVSDPWYHPGPHGEGGDCNSRKALSVPFWAGMGAFKGLHDGGSRLVVIGRTRHPGAAHVRFNYPVKKAVVTRIGRSGFFIVPITITRPIFTGLLPGSICRWSSTFVVLNAKGQEIAQKTETFGPRVCMRPPKPVVKIEGGTKTFILQRGMDGYLTEARPGDTVVCRGAGHVLTITIPQAAQRRYRRSHDRRLQLDVEHTRNGRISVMCWS